MRPESEGKLTVVVPHRKGRTRKVVMARETRETGRRTGSGLQWIRRGGAVGLWKKRVRVEEGGERGLRECKGKGG